MPHPHAIFSLVRYGHHGARPKTEFVTRRLHLELRFAANLATELKRAWAVCYSKESTHTFLRNGAGILRRDGVVMARGHHRPPSLGLGDSELASAKFPGSLSRRPHGEVDGRATGRTGADSKSLVLFPPRFPGTPTTVPLIVEARRVPAAPPGGVINVYSSSRMTHLHRHTYWTY